MASAIRITRICSAPNEWPEVKVSARWASGLPGLIISGLAVAIQVGRADGSSPSTPHPKDYLHDKRD